MPWPPEYGAGRLQKRPEGPEKDRNMLAQRKRATTAAMAAVLATVIALLAVIAYQGAAAAQGHGSPEPHGPPDSGRRPGPTGQSELGRGPGLTLRPSRLPGPSPARRFPVVLPIDRRPAEAVSSQYKVARRCSKHPGPWRHLKEQVMRW